MREDAVKMRRRAAAQRAWIQAHPPQSAGSVRALDVDDCEPSTCQYATTLITIGGSAGALSSACRIVAALHADPVPAVIVALHGSNRNLVTILRRLVAMPVRWAVDQEMLRAGCAYVAPPRHHVVVNPDRRLSVSDVARVGFFRPSIDWLFESAAAAFEDHHVAVVLGGRLNDGAAGVRRVWRLGGFVIAEDPASCAFAAMPMAAIGTGCVAAELPKAGLAAGVARAARSLEACHSRWEEPFSA